MGIARIVPGAQLDRADTQRLDPTDHLVQAEFGKQCSEHANSHRIFSYFGIAALASADLRTDSQCSALRVSETHPHPAAKACIISHSTAWYYKKTAGPCETYETVPLMSSGLGMEVPLWTFRTAWPW